MSDTYDYPSDSAVLAIDDFEIQNTDHCHILLGIVRDLWWMPEWGWRVTRPGCRYELSTSGWSGNETLIYALEQNQPFWRLSWVSTHRGGHYESQPGACKIL